MGYLRKIKPRLAYITLARLGAARKARHYVIDVPHLIFLRKIKPRLG